MLEIKNVSKSFGTDKILNNFNLKIEKGNIYSILGENGSGKTTLLNLIAGLIQFDKNNESIISINGLTVFENEVKYKKMFGYVTATPFFYNELTIKEFIYFVATLYDENLDRERYENLLKVFEINGDLFIGNLSFGQKQKVAIITSLIHRPELLIFDEPTIGLDPISLNFFKKLIISLKNFGVTILFATHILEIAAVLSDKIGILKNGKIFALGNIDELRKQADTTIPDLEQIFIKLTGGQKYENLLKTLENLEKNEKNHYSNIY